METKTTMEAQMDMRYYNTPNVEAYNLLYENYANSIISASDFDQAEAIYNEFVAALKEMPERHFSNINLMDDLYRLSLRTNLFKLLLQTHPMSLPF